VSLTPREKSRRKAKIIKELIEELDAIRAFRLFNTSRALRYISELRLEGDLWREVQIVLKTIALWPTQDKSFPRIKRADSIADILFMASFAGMIGSLILMLLNLELFLAYIFLLSTLVLMNLSYILKFYVSVKIRNIYLSRRSELEGYDGLLKKAVDNLLFRLRGELKKAGIGLSEVDFKLYNGDYAGLVVEEEKKGVYKLKFK